MEIENKIIDVIKRYWAKFPVPVDPQGPFTPSTPRAVVSAHEERCRQWNIKLVEQIAFEYPNEGYGCKRASATRPIGKDTIARQRGAMLECWDILSGAGTGKPVLDLSPAYHDIRGQVFVPVTGRDHLGETKPEEPPVPPTPTPTPCICKGCECKYNEALLLAKLGKMLSQLSFEANILGRRVTFTPVVKDG